MVFGEPVPAGVTGLRAAGRHYTIKRWVWMRLEAPGLEALESLIALTEDRLPLPEPQASRETRRSLSGNGRHDAADKARVGWGDAARIARPEVYRFACGEPLSTGGGPGWIWTGVMIVDREQGLVFIHSGGD